MAPYSLRAVLGLFVFVGKYSAHAVEQRVC